VLWKIKCFNVVYDIMNRFAIKKTMCEGFSVGGIRVPHPTIPASRIHTGIVWREDVIPELKNKSF
jgi:hypothetical protein